jgi:hypothetical protein
VLFADHFNSSFKSLGFVLRNGREFSDVDTLKLLYFTYVRSRLEYASIVWSPMYGVIINYCTIVGGCALCFRCAATLTSCYKHL